MERIDNDDIVCVFSADKKDENESIYSVNATKSFTLSTNGCISNRSEPIVNLAIHISCISNCTISFMRCKFQHSLFIIEDANIDISGTIFVDSYLIVQSSCTWNDLSIIQTDFQNDANHSSTLFNKSMPFEEACQTSKLLEGVISGNGSFPWTGGKRESSERYCAFVNLRGMWKSITLEALSFIGSDVNSYRLGGVYLTEVEVMVMKIGNSQVTKLPTKVLLASSSLIETLTVQYTTFHNNTDGLDFGDTCIQHFLVKNCTFSSNGLGFKGEFTKCTSAIRIGQIMNMSVVNCYFKENSAGTNAGLQCHGAALQINSHLYHHQQSMTALNDSHGTQTEVAIMDSIFKENVNRYGNGGAISLTGHTILRIHNVKFIDNSAHLGLGGALHVEQSEVFVSNSIFIRNVAKLGAGIYLSNSVYSSLQHIHNRDNIRNYAIISACHFQGTSNVIIGFKEITIIAIHISNLTVLKSSQIVIRHSVIDAGRIDILTESININPNQKFTIHITSNSFVGKSKEESGLSILVYNRAKLYDYAKLEIVVASCSFMLSRSSFSSGGAVGIDIYKPEMFSGGSWNVSVVGCNFTHGLASEQGGAIRMYFIAATQTQNSANTLIFYQCNFIQNKAKYGGAVAIMYGGDIYKSYLWPQVVNFTITIFDCHFESNEGSNEGGAVYLELINTVEVFVRNSVFLNNEAEMGSCIIRETMLAMDMFDFHPFRKKELQSGNMTTHVFNCKFENNLNTAILLLAGFSDRHYAALIEGSEFVNNRGTNSTYSDDIYCDVNLSLEKVHIIKSQNSIWSKSIDTSSKSALTDVKIIISNSFQTQVIEVVTFSLYIQNKVSESLSIICPAYYRPTVSHAGLTHEGASVVEFYCVACSKGYYYIGDSIMQSHAGKRIKEGLLCSKRLNPYLINGGIMSAFCHSDIDGKCLSCPFGADCTGGARALPGYWGHKASDGSLEFHRCPDHYCCNQHPCDDIDHCAPNRGGYLCGQCTSNYTEALFSPQCVPNTKCKSYWILFIYLTWVFLLTSIFLFFGEITNVLKNVSGRYKPCRKWQKTRKWSPRSMTTSHEEMQKPIVEIFCKGFVTVKRHHSKDSSESYKYLQILLFYLQDAYLMQVNLKNDSSDGQIAVVRHVLYNVSHLAFGILKFGMELCPWIGWTAVTKKLAKSSTGPVIIMLLLMIYLVIRCVCRWMPKDKQTICRHFWFPKLSCATLLCLLVFYQQTAMVTFSFLYCISGNDRHVLFIDGTIDCYQPWQIAIFVFAFFWIVPFVFVLTFSPGMMDANLISITDFFFLCAFPIPVSLFLLYKYLNKKLMEKQNDDLSSKTEVLNLLQKSYIDIIVLKNTKICWMGVITARRLTLILFFTFIENLVLRLSAMVLLTLLFLVCLHQKIYPYQDNMANRVFTVSLVLSCLIGIVNMMKATCIEFLLDLDSGKETVKLLDIFLDVIMIWCPATLSMFGIILVKACKPCRPCKWRVVNVKPLKIQ